jgi:hypothetical protein
VRSSVYVASARDVNIDRTAPAFTATPPRRADEETSRVGELATGVATNRRRNPRR